MMKRPTEVALRRFGILYSTFQLRSWVTAAIEAPCRDKYLALLDYLRADLIDFLMGLEFLQAHEHIFHLFKICCLCLTSASPQFPTVFMGGIDTNDFQSRVADVILFCKSYLSEVANSLDLCCTDANLDKFSLLSASFGQSGFSADYDPWTYVDTFERSAIYQSLVSSHRSVLSGTDCVLRVQWQPILPPSEMRQLSNCLVTVSEGGWIKASPVQDPPL